jgi:hypothetical protein
VWKFANLPSVGCTDIEITKRRVIERERPANKAFDSAGQPTPTSGWPIHLTQILLGVFSFPWHVSQFFMYLYQKRHRSVATVARKLASRIRSTSGARSRLLFRARRNTDTGHMNSIERRKGLKVKVHILHALRFCTGRTAHRGSRCIALLFLDYGTRRG